MSNYSGNHLLLAIASILLSACGKGTPASPTPDMSPQDAYKHCTSNQVLSMQLGSTEPKSDQDLPEAMAKIINACMEKYQYKCAKATPNEPCDWKPIK